ncbi:MAG: site-specific integrase [Thermoflexales bacterium]|nr:site-specific integrase [Thermoflexales bacterium]
MGKHGSMSYQVTEALKGIFTPGVSRHALKQCDLANRRIVGISTMRNYVSDGTTFAQWCKREYGIQRIGDITPAMAEEYTQGMRDCELSGGYIGRVECAIRKLDVAMRKRKWRGRDAEPLLPAQRDSPHSDRRPERAYTPEQADKLIDDMRERAKDKQVVDVVQLQQVAGLRVSEAAMIRGEDIDAERCVIQVVDGTKGGRSREVQVGLEHREFLVKLREKAGGRRDGRVFCNRGDRGSALAKRVRSAVKCACERMSVPNYGTHGFRKCYAQDKHKELLTKGGGDRNARQAVARELGHNRVDVTYSYVSRL